MESETNRDGHTEQLTEQIIDNMQTDDATKNENTESHNELEDDQNEGTISSSSDETTTTNTHVTSDDLSSNIEDIVIEESTVKLPADNCHASQTTEKPQTECSSETSSREIVVNEMSNNCVNTHNDVSDGGIKPEQKDSDVNDITVPNDSAISQQSEMLHREEPTLSPEQPLPAAEEPEWLDVLGNGELKKKVLSAGEGDKRPKQYDEVKIDYTCSLENGQEVEKIEETQIFLGTCEIVQGLDLAIPLMAKGETAEIVVSPRFGYGHTGFLPEIPGNATLVYKVKLHEFSPEPDYTNMEYKERGDIGLRLRKRGNFWYGRGEHSIAIQCYRRALEYLDDESENFTDLPEEAHALIEDRILVYNNLAAAQLKIRAYDSALRSVEQVLLCKPTNVKAIFRKGKILAAKGSIDEAIVCFRRANELEPETRAIHQELSQLLSVRKIEQQKEKSLYAKMFPGASLPNKEMKTEKKRNSKVSNKWKTLLAVAVVGVAFGVYKIRSSII